jgi:APA family basic amino acid/polyamine antiporter
VFRVPSKSIILQFLIAAVMVMSGTFDQILTYMGFCMGIFPIFAVIGVFKFICVSLSILVLVHLERPVESSIALATVAVGIPIYTFFSNARREATETGE